MSVTEQTVAFAGSVLETDCMKSTSDTLGPWVYSPTNNKPPVLILRGSRWLFRPDGNRWWRWRGVTSGIWLPDSSWRWKTTLLESYSLCLSWVAGTLWATSVLGSFNVIPFSCWSMLRSSLPHRCSGKSVLEVCLVRTWRGVWLVKRAVSNIWFFWILNLMVIWLATQLF